MSTLSTTDRMAMVSRHLTDAAANHYRVVGQIDPFTVQIRQLRPMPARPNPLTHLVIMFATCGFWIFPWAILQGVWYNQVQSWRRSPYSANPPLRLHVQEDGQATYTEETSA